MKAMTLRSYRVGLNVEALTAAAQNLVKASEKIEPLGEVVGWNQPEMKPYLMEAFKPQLNAKELATLFKQFSQTQKLKSRRITKGYADLMSPRQGFSGWWQKRYDKKELELPIAVNVLEWLHSSKRLVLLIAMHESLLQHAMIGDPTEVEFAEISSISRSLGDMVANGDTAKVNKLVKVLGQPLHKIDPNFLIEGVTGYVSYQTSRGFAYYYA